MLLSNRHMINISNVTSIPTCLEIKREIEIKLHASQLMSVLA